MNMKLKKEIVYTDNVNFVISNFSSEESCYETVDFDRRVDVILYFEKAIAIPKWLDYFCCSFTTFGNANANTQWAKFVLTLKDISQIILLTLLMGFCISAITRYYSRSNDNDREKYRFVAIIMSLLIAAKNEDNKNEENIKLQKRA